MQTVVHLQTPKSILYTVDNYFPLEYANDLFQKCKNLDLIVEPQMKMGIAHRCMNFYSNVSEGYYFSQQLMRSVKLPDYMETFIQATNASLKSEFNGLLVNYYRNGEDSIGLHADDESGLHRGNKVVAYTMMNPGGTRIFRLRANKADSLSAIPGLQTASSISTSGLYYDVITKHNQLLIMEGDFQKEFKHEVPVEKSNKNAERVSITERYHRK